MSNREKYPNNNGYGWYQCECCPYGYHIDLDFVRYCESVSQEADRSGSIKRRKDRRRQRQSMEVLLGLTPPSPSAAAAAAAVGSVFDHNYKTISECTDSSNCRRKDGFDDAVYDFEQTLQKTKRKYNNLPDVTAVSNVNRTIVVSKSTCKDHEPKDFEAGIDSCGLTPAALQNIREQMALSLERTKELEDQVKLIPNLKAQLAVLAEEKKQLILELKTVEEAQLIRLRRNRSQSFSEIITDNFDCSTKPVPRPPLRRDIGVMCGVLTRNVGVGHQYPHVRDVSTFTVSSSDDDQEGQQPTPVTFYSDKWYNEKIKFLSNESNAKNRKECVGTQTPSPKPKRTDDRYTQTLEKNKEHHVTDVAITAKPIYSDAVNQTNSINTRNIGISVESPCKICSISKISIGVGSENATDENNVSPVSLANLALAMPARSKSFNLGGDKLNLMSMRNRTIGCQYEPLLVNSIACQCVIKVKSKACQNDNVIKVSHKGSQHEYRAALAKGTDTNDLSVEKVNVACEAKEMEKEKVDFACNTSCKWLCAKCVTKEREKEREEIVTKEGSPTPSRIPIPTTPVENRKFRRQDTYTKIPSASASASSPMVKLQTTNSSLGLSALVDLPTSTTAATTTTTTTTTSTSTSTSPIEKVKSKLQEATAASSTSAQNGVGTKEQHVQQELAALPAPETTSLQHCIEEKPRQKKVEPSKEMQAAIKVLNDSLQKNQTKNIKTQVKNAINIIQQEWFKISSLVTANPLDVEDYLDAFEDVSSALLEYIVNITDASGNTAMHYAVSHGNFDVVSILLDSKVCDINKTNKAGYTSTMLVSLAEVRSQTHANVVRRLFKLADVNIRAKQHGQTALMLAVSHGRIDMVEMLLEAGADINIQDEDGSTALMCAAEHGHIEIVKHFLSQPDCDSSITDVDGSTALKIAMEAGHRHIGVLLYAHERNLHGTKLHKKSKSTSASPSPKTPSSPLPFRSSHRALTDPKNNK